MSLMRYAAPLLAMGLLSACGGDLTCDDPQIYQAALPGDRIVAPDDLSELQSFKEMKIPDVSPQPPRPEGLPCLERPPAYQNQR